MIHVRILQPFRLPALRLDSPVRKPRSLIPGRLPRPDDAMGAAGDGLSMLPTQAFERDVGGEPARQIDHRRVAPLDDALLRAEEEVVERSAADKVGEPVEPGCHHATVACLAAALAKADRSFTKADLSRRSFSVGGLLS